MKDKKMIKEISKEKSSNDQKQYQVQKKYYFDF